MDEDKDRNTCGKQYVKTFSYEMKVLKNDLISYKSSKRSYFY